MKTDKFYGLIRTLLNEELQKRKISVNMRLPEMNGNGVDQNKKKHKTFGSDENPRDKKTKDELLSDLKALVGDINKEYKVVWDDHDDIKIEASDLMKMTITPDWEDHYEIVVFTRNEDRVVVVGLDWDQVKDFVKGNLTLAKRPTTYVEKAYDKSYRNRKDQTTPPKDLPQKDKVKLKTVPSDKNKEKNYTESPTKEEDLPNMPMKEVDDTKRQGEYKVKDPVKLRKRIPDKKLIVKSS